MPNANYTDVEFVTRWKEAIAKGEGYNEIAASFGASWHNVKRRAARLREDGVDLPPLPRGGNRKRTADDVAKLNALLGDDS